MAVHHGGKVGSAAKKLASKSTSKSTKSTERQRKGCTKQSGVDSGDERSCEPLTKTSKA